MLWIVPPYFHQLAMMEAKFSSMSPRRTSLLLISRLVGAVEGTTLRTQMRAPTFSSEPVNFVLIPVFNVHVVDEPQG